MSVYAKTEEQANLLYVNFPGSEPQPEPLHYKECGLDNVHLMNGFHMEEFDGEEYLVIEDADALWRAIAVHIVTKHKSLGPKEVRFLRRHMDMTQAELAFAIRVSDQTIARWEKGVTDLDGPADVAIRLTYLHSKIAQPDGLEKAEVFFETTIKDIVDAEDEPSPGLMMRRREDSWKSAAA